MNVAGMVWGVCGLVFLNPDCAGAVAYERVILAGKVGGVRTGLTATAEDGRLVMGPGSAEVDGRLVDVATTVSLAVEASDIRRVSGEEVVLPRTISVKWMPGGHLEKSRTTNMIPGPLQGESLRVRLTTGEELVRDKDYVVDDRWAKLAWKAGGMLTTDTKVLVDYDYGLLRIDGVDLGPEGKITVVKGEADLVCPKPPAVAPGRLRLLQIFRPYGERSLEGWQIFACGGPFAEPSAEEQRSRSRSVAGALDKLRSGKAVTVVTWGDSVTVGGDTSKPELAYANLFISRLKERFPGATITHVNAGIGGSNTNDRLPGLDKDVLSHKPDLVTIEFVNDLHIPLDQMEKNWKEALKRIRATGSDVVVITPHFTMPEFMGNELPRGPEMRPGVAAMKRIAEEQGVGLADTSRRWAHLDEEGIPYITLLYNGINHPDDRGHEMFVKDLMNLFPR